MRAFRSLGLLLIKLAELHAAVSCLTSESWLGIIPLCMLTSTPRYVAVSFVKPFAVSLERTVVNLAGPRVPLLSRAIVWIVKRSWVATIISAALVLIGGYWVGVSVVCFMFHIGV